LASAEVDGMAALYQRYYTGAAPEAFARDLANKDFVALALIGQNVVGFSTVKVFRMDAGDMSVLFSGDTIVDASARGTAGLIDAYLALLARLLETEKDVPLYWLLISKGPRTYRILPTFFTRYYPGTEGDATLRPMLDRIAGERFGAAYDPVTHLYRPPPPRDRLRPEHCDFNAADAVMRWFDGANPEWRDGIELCTITPITHDNFNALARRRVSRIDVGWRE